MICVKLNGGTNCSETYTYDDLNRLVQYETADIRVRYSYDVFNRRLFKKLTETVNSDTIETMHTYTYDDWNIIEEEIHALNTTANPEVTTAWEIRRYVDSGMDNHIIMDISPVTNGTEGTASRIWFHKDERGNIIAISNNTGIILERYKYKVYGEHKVLDANFNPVTTKAISPFLWGGSLYEPETDLYWMRNRYYSKEMKRFINVDPLGIWGDANNLGNGFAYVAGMVVEASDPTGLRIGLYLASRKYAFAKEDNKDEETTLQEFSYGMSAGDFRENPPSNKLGIAISVIEQLVNIAPSIAKTNTFKSFLSFIKGKSMLERMKFSDLKNAKTVSQKKNIKEKYSEINQKINAKKQIQNTARTSYTSYTSNKPTPHLQLTPVKKTRTKIVRKRISGPTTDAGKTVNDGAANSSVEFSAAAVYVNVIVQEVYYEYEIKIVYYYPVHGDENVDDGLQQKLKENIMQKMLDEKRGITKETKYDVYQSMGPVIKNKDDVRGYSITFNPYYKGKDPIQDYFMEDTGPNGDKGLITNPFAPGAEYGYDSNTYEKIQQHGIIQPEVDPYFY